jgi:hypothetical protein
MLCSARWPPCRPDPRSPRRRGGPTRSCVRRRTKRQRTERRRDLLCAVHAIPGRRRAIPDQWWTSVLFGYAISVMKCALNLDEPGQEVTMKVLDLTQLINYPVSATAPVGLCVFRRFPQTGTKDRESPRRGSYLCNVASRLAGACASPDPPQGFRCGRRGSLPFYGPKLSTERAPSTMSLSLIRQAVGLFASTNIDGDLDRKCASQSESLAAPLEPQPSVSVPDPAEHRSFTSDGS